jgi:hypothetical protein
MSKSTHYERIPVWKVKEIMAIRKNQGIQSHAPADIRPILLCRICREPVCLETAKTDDNGQAIHEVCYMSSLTRETGSWTRRSHS